MSANDNQVGLKTSTPSRRMKVGIFSSSTEICQTSRSPGSAYQGQPAEGENQLNPIPPHPLTSPMKRLNRRKKNLLSQATNAPRKPRKELPREQVLEFHNRRGYR
jgi:hypothetical protein